MNYRESKGPEQRRGLDPRGHTPKTMLPCAERLNSGSSNHEKGHKDQGSCTGLRTGRRMKVDVKGEVCYFFGQSLCGGEVGDPAESAVLRKPPWRESCVLWKEDNKLQSV